MEEINGQLSPELLSQSFSIQLQPLEREREEANPAITFPAVSPWDNGPEGLKFIVRHVVRGANSLSHLAQRWLFGVDDSAVENPDSEGRTELWYACAAGKLDVVQELLQRGANPNAADVFQATPFFEACRNGHAEIVRLLLQYGADIEVFDSYHSTPLAWASFNGHLSVVQLLVKAGAKVDSLDNNRDTPLANACRMGRRDIAVFLLDHGADLNHEDNYHGTALLIACMSGQQEIAELLLDRGADINVLDKLGYTPLQYALRSSVFKGTETLARLQAGDDGTSERMMLSKELANRFGIYVTIDVKGRPIQLSGWHVEVAGKTLRREVDAFYPKLTEAIEVDGRLWHGIMAQLSRTSRKRVNVFGKKGIQEVLLAAQHALTDTTMTTPSQAQRKLEQTGLVALLLSTGTHAVAVVIQKVGNLYRIARANKGDGSEPHPGIHLDFCASVDIDKLYPKVDLSFFTTDFRQDFRATKNSTYIRQKYQKTGNCSIANANGAELAVLYLLLEPRIGHDAALELAQAIKKRRCDISRTHSLTQYLDFYEKHPHLPIEKQVLHTLLNKRVTGTREDRQRRGLIKGSISA